MRPMTTRTRSTWTGKLSNAVITCVALGVLVYVMATGISIVAAAIAPGFWGYFGAAGFLAFIGPIPLLLLNPRAFARTGGTILLLGLSTMTYATIAGQHYWPAWAAVAWLGGLLLIYLVVRTIRSIPLRLTRRRAERLLRRHRSTGNQDAWTLRDWEWAYTHIGTKLALDQAAWCRMLRTRIE